MIKKCCFYLQRKQRTCRLPAVNGSKVCGEHLHKFQEISETDSSPSCLSDEIEVLKPDDPKIRIPCPLDPSHTCYLGKKEKHLKKCNAQKKVIPEYYQKNINGSLTCKSQEKRNPISMLSEDELLQLISRIESVSTLPELDLWNKSHSSMDDELKNPCNGTPALKHLTQQSHLLAILEAENLLTENICYIEFGAGGGKLTVRISEALKNTEGCKFVLIDRSTQRHKSDNKLKYEDGSVRERILIDIQDVCLEKVPTVVNHIGGIVAVSKHLCGSATDLTLRCLTRITGDSKLPQAKLTGVLMALCCHHRCSWAEYVGQEFFNDLGFTEKDFSLICGLTSWATCGRMEHIDKAEFSDSINSSYNRYLKLGLDYSRREAIGRKCKLLIDCGRSKYFEKFGMQSHLLHYVQPNISIENVALLFTLK